MSKEIVTTENMNLIVEKLVESAVSGNMTARMVHAVNDKINDLKVGKKLQKEDKDELMMLWDNLIVAFVNDAASSGYDIKEYDKLTKGINDSSSMNAILIGCADIADKVKEDAKKVSDTGKLCALGAGIVNHSDSDGFDLEELREALKGLAREDIHNQLDAFIDELTDKGSENSEESKTSEGSECNCEECKGKCQCGDELENNYEKLEDEEVIKAIIAILEDEEEERKRKENANKRRKIIIRTGGRFGALDEFDAIMDAAFERMLRY